MVQKAKAKLRSAWMDAEVLGVSLPVLGHNTSHFNGHKQIKYLLQGYLGHKQCPKISFSSKLLQRKPTTSKEV